MSEEKRGQTQLLLTRVRQSTRLFVRQVVRALLQCNSQPRPPFSARLHVKREKRTSMALAHKGEAKYLGPCAAGGQSKTTSMSFAHRGKAKYLAPFAAGV